MIKKLFRFVLVLAVALVFLREWTFKDLAVFVLGLTGCILATGGFLGKDRMARIEGALEQYASQPSVRETKKRHAEAIRRSGGEVHEWPRPLFIIYLIPRVTMMIGLPLVGVYFTLDKLSSFPFHWLSGLAAILVAVALYFVGYWLSETLGAVISVSWMLMQQAKLQAKEPAEEVSLLKRFLAWAVTPVLWLKAAVVTPVFLVGRFLGFLLPMFFVSLFGFVQLGRLVLFRNILRPVKLIRERWRLGSLTGVLGVLLFVAGYVLSIM